MYGTEDTSNVELLSHYGFVDRGASALSPSPTLASAFSPSPSPSPGASAADRRLIVSQPEAAAALAATLLSPLYLPYISPISPLYLPYIPPIYPLYPACISPVSPLYLLSARGGGRPRGHLRASNPNPNPSPPKP